MDSNDLPTSVYSIGETGRRSCEPPKAYRFEVDGVGIYEAVERSCPRDDKRRVSKPDGSWVPRVGEKYPGAISFWKEYGLKMYQESGLRAWHESVVAGKVELIEKDLADIEILYEDDFQVIGNIRQFKKTVRVDEYNIKWPMWFEQLYNEIWPSVEPYAVSLEHVGSTAVPGLAAKPIIDMVIIVDSTLKVPPVIRALNQIGYIHRGNLGIEGREAFRSPNHRIKHHLYLCAEGCIALKNQLTLRDHLRKDVTARDQYAELKRMLATKFENSMEDYIQGKTQFILDVISQYKISPSDLASIKRANQAPSRK